MWKIKRCVRVIGDDGQSRIVDVHDAMDAKSIFQRVLHKFSIYDDLDKYSIFVGASDTGTGMRL
jgi:mitogen-activated protein kinase kinase kinase